MQTATERADTPDTATPDANTPQAKPEPMKWPSRRRPKDLFNEALSFLALAIDACAKHPKLKPLTKETVYQVRPLFNAWCKNTGLRGKHKHSTWAIIKAQLLDAAAQTAPGKGL